MGVSGVKRGKRANYFNCKIKIYNFKKAYFKVLTFFSKQAF